MIIGIDATNIRGGGGITHLVEIFRAANPAVHCIDRAIVWATRRTLACIEDRPWLQKRDAPLLERGLLARAAWQSFQLAREARRARCDVLLVPGGSYTGAFRPAVVMSRNMLPFEWREMRRYGASWMFARCALLRLTQGRSFRRADGLIFLTAYAKREITRIAGADRAVTEIIPHGIDAAFFREPRAQLPIEQYTPERPYRVTYVSIVDVYKHQWHVVEAVHALRGQRLPIALDLVGPAYPPALRRLQTVIDRLDPQGAWVRYRGNVPHRDLPRIYADSDMLVFASSCENMPNILLECMAAGAPIACSSRGPMPEVLGPSGEYFDPEQPATIADAIRRLIESPRHRSERARQSFERARTYSWTRCATDTLTFLARVAHCRGLEESGR